MDYGCDGRSGVEIPENAEYILFAEDVVNYIMSEYSSNYVSERGPIEFRASVKNQFDDIIQRSIHDISIASEKFIEDFLPNTDLHSMIKSTENYINMVNILKRSYFEKRLNARAFLIHCTNVSFIAASFYNDGLDTAPELAKSHIVNVVKKYMPAHGWDIVRRSAEIFPIDDAQSSTESSSDEDYSKALKSNKMK